MFLVVKSLTRHDGFQAESVGNSSLRREEFEQFDSVEHNMDRQEFWDPLKWKAVSGSPAPLLHHPDSAFDFRDMLVAAGQVEHWTAWQGLDQSLEGPEFPVRMHHCDAETAMALVLVYLLE